MVAFLVLPKRSAASSDEKEEGPGAPARTYSTLMIIIMMAKPVSKKIVITPAADQRVEKGLSKELCSIPRQPKIISRVIGDSENYLYGQKVVHLTWILTGCITGVFPP